MPEQIALREFLKHASDRDHPTLDARSELPRWKAMQSVEVLRGKVTLLLDPSSPGEFYRADARPEDNLGVIWSLVARPLRSYVMLAGFLYLGPRPESADQVICYCLRFLRLDPDEPWEAMLKRLVLAEVEVFKSSPKRQMTIANPAVVDFHLETADEATTLDMDLTTWRKEFKNELPPLPRNRGEQHVGDVLAQLASFQPAPPKGRRPEITQALARTLYEELLPVCQDVLTALKGRGWPPFIHIKSAQAFVTARYQGDEDVSTALATVLTTGQRRPGPNALAFRVTLSLTGLSDTWLRQLIRK